MKLILKYGKREAGDLDSLVMQAARLTKVTDLPVTVEWGGQEQLFIQAVPKIVERKESKSEEP